MKQRKSPPSPKRARHSGSVARASAKDEVPELSREWRREIERRMRDLRDPVRYMLVSEFSRTFVLYSEEVWGAVR